jgi:3,8-divinyl chlorophyllide a/chlorophyllide a reductase subunit Y
MTARWPGCAIGAAFGIAADKVAAAQNAFLPAIRGALAQPDQGHDHAVGL